jgi:hypothetical protein
LQKPNQNIKIKPNDEHPEISKSKNSSNLSKSRKGRPPTHKLIFCSKGSSIYHVQPNIGSFELSDEENKEEVKKAQPLSPMQKLHKALDKQDFVFKTKKGVILKL